VSNPSPSILRARYLLPIDRPPIRDGWVETAGGRIVAVGHGPPPSGARDLGEVALLPGLVNAHTHLELSWMAGRVPPAESMDQWIRAVLRLRRAGAPDGAAGVARAAAGAAAAMRRTGTVLIGEVTNDLLTPSVLSREGLGGLVFHELLGFAPEDPAGLVRDAWSRVRAVQAQLEPVPEPPIDFSVVAHSPYSVSPELFAEVVRRTGDAPLTVHLAESPEEVEFLHTGRGPMQRMLEELDVWTGRWEPPRCPPVEYLDRLGYLRPGVLVVHGVQLSDDELDQLREAEAVLVTCPRSNAWVGAGLPRLTHFYAAGMPVAIGTDSLASAPTLNLFDELAEMRRIAPDVAASALLDSATRVGASALGFGAEHGTLSPGKWARFVAVDLPPGVGDVEEYLVGGVSAQAIRPLTA
jgi:cytosine/adenosine deaminase-related metal-dependent hydrolase